jgi:hypothetical protein
MMMRLHVSIEPHPIPSTEDVDQAEILQHPKRSVNRVQRNHGQLFPDCFVDRFCVWMLVGFYDFLKNNHSLLRELYSMATQSSFEAIHSLPECILLGGCGSYHDIFLFKNLFLFSHFVKPLYSVVAGHFAFCLNLECGSLEIVSKLVNGAGFQPLSFLLLHSRGSAPGWYEAAPSALTLMRSHIFESAKGAGHISLGQSPRKESQQEIKG